MEVFTDLWTGVKYLYYFYFISIHTVTSLVLPAKYAIFATALILNYIPIALVSRSALNMTFRELMFRHYGMWIYALFFTFLWLFLTENGAIDMKTKDGASRLVVAIFVSLAGIWGPLQLRGEIFKIQRGIERSRGYDDLED